MKNKFLPLVTRVLLLRAGTYWIFGVNRRLDKLYTARLIINSKLELVRVYLHLISKGQDQRMQTKLPLDTMYRHTTNQRNAACDTGRETTTRLVSINKHLKMLYSGVGTSVNDFCFKLN